MKLLKFVDMMDMKEHYIDINSDKQSGSKYKWTRGMIKE